MAVVPVKRRVIGFPACCYWSAQLYAELHLRSQPVHPRAQSVTLVEIHTRVSSGKPITGKRRHP